MAPIPYKSMQSSSEPTSLNLAVTSLAIPEAFACTRSVGRIMLFHQLTKALVHQKCWCINQAIASLHHWDLAETKRAATSGAASQGSCKQVTCKPGGVVQACPWQHGWFKLVLGNISEAVQQTHQHLRFPGDHSAEY